MTCTIHQRPDGLWTVLKDGQEVEGIASPYRANAENFIRAIAVMQRPGGKPYIHLTYRDGTEETH